MEDLNIDKEKLFAIETLGELEDLYIDKISKDDSFENRQRLEPLRKSINFLRNEYSIDDKSEYLYNQYVKGIRYSIIYSDLIKQIENESDGINNSSE